MTRISDIVHCDPDILGGTPVFAGTRVPLLRRMAGQYDVLLTMDRGIEFQQNLAAAAVGVLLIRARSNRMTDLLPPSRQSSRATSSLVLPVPAAASTTRVSSRDRPVASASG